MEGANGAIPLYLCDERGLAKSRSHLRYPCPGFQVSAHLKSTLITQSSTRTGSLGLEE